MIDRMKRLCERYTLLYPEEIEHIVIESKAILTSKIFSDKEVFVDVIDQGTGEARVVFHRKPTAKPTMYSEGLVGKLMKRKNEPGVYRTLETSLNSTDLLAKSPDGRVIIQQVYPLMYKAHVIGAVVIEEASQAVIAAPQVEVPVATKENPQRYIVDNIDYAVLNFNEKGILNDCNDFAVKLFQDFGYLGNIQGLHYDNLSIDHSTFKQILALGAACEGENSLTKEVRFFNGYYSLKYVFYREARGVILIIQNITELKETKLAMIRKSEVIQEIHHRVKNNLQTIVSLLRIQKRQMADSEAKKVFSETINRIFVIAASHELLSKEFEDKIKLVNVLESIVNNLMKSYDQSKLIKIELMVDSTIVLASDTTVTLALIINELVQNAYDHAFTGKESGCVTITCRENQEGRIELELTDDGVGYNPQEKEKQNLGLQIVHSYVREKLCGRIRTYSNSKGTKILISFQKKKKV
ncbi:two-component sensor histidine kinase [Enterococcus sp. PF1-24]|uniref:sensor histidine kinase n=1 Tax=unclassified Enterococcus TaxID=2608891 RepID=UPI002473C60A|nr:MULTISPECIES: histidine kinase N-terminal domain-containing protein [unclassified Enterococcus]MDH6364921.1 two-component sensor histidine kinase [Enterococcus sp. PFB1-1]MDH6402022.1 two-component sensor histidine kinase [Enterococcus sp. PF1-24]